MENIKTDLVIVGAGIFGASIAYYYKRNFPQQQVTVIDQNEICSGNTPLAAALLSRFRSDPTTIPLALETFRVIEELEAITGDLVPMKLNGALHLASGDKQAALLDKMLLLASYFGISYEQVSFSEAEKMVPWLRANNTQKRILVHDEAFTEPYVLCQSFAKAAKILGVKFRKNEKFEQLLVADGSVTGLKTTAGTIFADRVILASGVWAPQIYDQLQIALPMSPVRSQYWITEPQPQLFPAQMPTVIIPEANFYGRPQSGGLLFGLRESPSMVADARQLPSDLYGYPFSHDSGWTDLENGFEKLLPFFPNFENLGIKNYVAGFSGYTPDSRPILGAVNQIEGLFLATGCVGAGITLCGGIGLGMAQLAAEKPNPFDFSTFNPHRFGDFDPFHPDHLKRCGEARSGKSSG